jgi:predicted DNA-binding protein with PD1-like motif
MRGKLTASDAPLRVFVVVFYTGDDVVAGLTSFADDHAIDAAAINGIGECHAFIDLGT